MKNLAKNPLSKSSRVLRRERFARLDAAVKEDMLENQSYYEAWPSKFMAILLPAVMVPALLPIGLMAPEWFGVGFIPASLGFCLTLQQNRIPYTLRVLRGKVSPPSSVGPIDIGELRADRITDE